MLKHQAIASEDGFVTDFTQYGRIRPPLDSVGNKPIMAVPRMGFDPDSLDTTLLPYVHSKNVLGGLIKPGGFTVPFLESGGELFCLFLDNSSIVSFYRLALISSAATFGRCVVLFLRSVLLDSFDLPPSFHLNL